MPSPADTVSKDKASKLIPSHWRPKAIARKHPSILYRTNGGIGSRCKGRLIGLHTYRSTSLNTFCCGGEYQKQNPWAYQDEMVIFLEEHWGIIRPGGLASLRATERSINFS
jgi:hypothetical protein